ncbi:hypothetical protein V5O48_011269 [Marasmius crinis-equi]|uniref:Uncharacterized protein n=1 Tax=Marasmius crinis-equi TaxID=585013 RepID=A0ABR3F647_9AGAR
MTQTQQDLDAFLIQWIASNDPDGHGRIGGSREMFEKLGQEPTSVLTASLWMNRYTRKKFYFDTKIAEYINDERSKEVSASTFSEARHDTSKRLHKPVQRKTRLTRNKSPTWHRYTEEEDLRLAEFVDTMVALGYGSGSRKIYQILVKNEGGKWPWAAKRSVEAWRSRYLITLRKKLAPDMKRKLAQPDVYSALHTESRAKTETQRQKGSKSSVSNSNLAKRSTVAHLAPSSADSSSSTASDQLKLLAAEMQAAVSRFPEHSPFNAQDNMILLNYLLTSLYKRAGGTRGSLAVETRPEKDCFQRMIDSVPAARRHTAQAWKSHYYKLKTHFDRLIDQLRKSMRGSGSSSGGCHRSPKRKLDLLEDFKDSEHASKGTRKYEHVLESEAEEPDLTDDNLEEEAEVERSLCLVLYLPPSQGQ